MTNSFALLEGFSSDNVNEYNPVKPEAVKKQKVKKTKAKKAAPASVEDKKPVTFKKNPKAKQRGHGLDRNRMQTRRGKTYDRSKPGKPKKGGSGKGNWGKNDGKVPAQKFIAEKTEKTVETPEGEQAATPVEEVAAPVEEAPVEPEDNTVTYEEYMKKHSSGVATKRGTNKIDNSNLDQNLQKRATEKANQGVAVSKSSKRGKNKRRKKGQDLASFLQNENVNFSGKQGGAPQQKRGGNKKAASGSNAPNLSSAELFPALRK